MYQRRHQAQSAKARMLYEASLKMAKRITQQFTEAVRDEVFTIAYTDLEKAFGEQPELTLMTIDKGLQASLKSEDARWSHGVDRRYSTGPVVPMPKVVDKSQDEKLARVIRDEFVDLLGQYVYDHITREHAVTQAWVNQLVEKPEMQPPALIAAAKIRHPKIV